PATKVYQYNGYPGGYQSITEGNKIARSMLDALQAEKALGKGASHDTRINPGYTFKLTRHTSKRLNKKYVVLGVTHEGTVDDSGKAHYQNRFYCMRANERFVPIYGLAHRRVYGPQTATVAGPANEEIFVDEYGRVKVQFHWDQEGNGNSSAWIRVSQMMAGDGWGSLFIPRIGHEVIVDFLDGNPDRPIITGQVYNGNNQPPYPLPAGKTRSGIKTRSSKNGGSRSSELCFEDKKGSEEVLLKSAKDLMTQAANNMNIAVGNNLHYNVSQNYTFVVSNTANSSIGGNQTDNTGSNRTSIIGNNHKLNIGKNKTVEVGAHYQETTQKTRTIKAGKINIEASDGFSVKVGKAAISLSKNGTITLKSDGNINIKSAKKISIKAAKISQDDY
ncbi:MAG TPA: type VI secretion system tip protein VgrG, partial [Gammaproteobacteria bacterium]|nr:type VI secretion system tip protein VgrG [Gammaproteobacteria bacterium]